MKLEAIGVAGQKRLTDDTLIISRRGLLGLLTQGLKGDKEIRLDQISSVRFKDPGFTNGYTADAEFEAKKKQILGL